MSSDTAVPDTQTTRRRLQEIKLIPNKSNRPISVKVSVDDNLLFELPAIEQGRALLWKDLMLPCDLEDDSIVRFLITEVHTFRSDRVGAAVFPASMMVQDESLSTECDNGMFKLEVMLMSHDESKEAYASALGKARQIEKRQSRLNTSGKVGSAVKGLLALGTALSELDPTGGAKVAFSVCTMVWQRLEEQEQQDESIDDFVEQLVQMTPTVKSVQNVADANLKNTVTAMLYLVEDASIFILNYKSRGALAHIVYSAIGSKEQDRIRDIVKRFKQHKEDFDRKMIAQTLIAVQLAHDQDSLDKLKPVGHASFNPDHACIADTRVDVIEDIVTWSEDFDSDQRLLWVYGFAGLGKSSIAASVCQRLKSQDLLGASFFCKRDDPELRDARCLINTVIYGLSMRHGAYKQAVAKAIQADQQICTAHMQQRYDSLVKGPLKILEDGKFDRRLVIIVDALDETAKDEHRATVLTCLRNMCRIVPWLKVIIMSRPDEDIKIALDQGEELTRSLNIADHNAVDDIRTFVRRRMVVIARSKGRSEWPEDKVERLASRANGLFIWADTACKFIDAGISADARLNQLLQVHQSAGKLHPLAGLDELYTTAILSGIKDEGEDNINMVCLCIGAIVVTSSRAPLPISDLTRLLSGQVDIDTLSASVKALSSVLYEEGGPGGPIRVYHPSFEDYITDSSRSNAYYVDLRQYNTMLAKCCLDTMLAELKFNICDLQTSYALNKDVPDMQQRVQTLIAGHLRHSCLYWYTHYAEAEVDSLANRLTLFLLGKSLIYWVEALSLLGKLVVALTSMLGLSASYKNLDSPKGCSDCANDMYRFVLSFYDPISKSAPHLYISALAFTPTSSDFGRRMRPLFPNTVAVTICAEEEWSSCLQTISHPDEVSSVAFSFDNRRIVSGCNDKTVRVWDAETGSAVMDPLKGHTGGVFSVAFSSDARYIASGSYDQTIRIWNSETGVEVCEPLRGHSGVVRSVAFSPNGLLVVSGSADHTVRIWDVKTGQCTLKLERHSNKVLCIAFSPNGRYIASGADDMTVIVWDAKTGDPVMEPIPHTDMVLAVCFSPDSSLIASGTEYGKMTIWERESGTKRSEFAHPDATTVQSVAFSPNGQQIASGSGDGVVRIWDVESSCVLGKNERKHSNRVWSVAYSSDGRRIASCAADHTVRIWDAEADTEIFTGSSRIDSVPINCVAVSPNGRLIVTGSDDKALRVWDSATGIVKGDPLKGHSDLVLSAAFSHDGRRIVSGSADETVLVWDVETGNTVLGPLSGHSDWVCSVAFSLDGQYIVSGSGDCTVCIWDSETGKEAIEPLAGHTDVVRSVAFSPDGRSVVSASDDQTVRVWDAKTGTPQFDPLKGHSNEVRSVAFFPSGKHIVSCSTDGIARIWDADAGDLDRVLEHTSPSNYLNAIAVTHESRYVVAGSGDGTLQLWDLTSVGNTAKSLRGHSDAVESVAVSPDGLRIASGSDDGTLRLWDANKVWATDDWNLSLKSLDTLTALDASEAARHVGPDGWVKSATGELLFWLPAAHRVVDESLMCMTPEGIRPRATIDLTRFVHGSNWVSVMAVE